MKRIERDFITLFNCLWYQEFPVTEADGVINRANWTIHLGLVVRQCAKLLGARAFFEQGGRTDAILRFPEGQVLSNVEWEWTESHKEKVDELEKLLGKADSAAFSTFVSYSKLANLPEALAKATEIWSEAKRPLIFFVITYESKGRDRVFLELQTYFFSKGKYKKVRTQPALPWQVNRNKFNNASDEE